MLVVLLLLLGPFCIQAASYAGIYNVYNLISFLCLLSIVVGHNMYFNIFFVDVSVIFMYISHFITSLHTNKYCEKIFGCLFQTFQETRSLFFSFSPGFIIHVSHLFIAYYFDFLCTAKLRFLVRIIFT